MTPPGTTSLVHNNLHNRGTGAPQRQEGFYVSPAMLYYRCITSYILKMAHDIVPDTMKFIPGTQTFPRITSKDMERYLDTYLTKWIYQWLNQALFVSYLLNQF